MNNKLLKIKAEFEAIRKANGGFITPEEVVKQAKNRKSILHDQFCWDDTEAAEKYRLMQAGHLIRSIKVNVIINDRTQETVEVREYVSLPNDRGESGYRHIAQVMTDTDLRKQYLESIKAEFIVIEGKLKTVSGLAQRKGQELLREIDKQIMKVEGRAYMQAV